MAAAVTGIVSDHAVHHPANPDLADVLPDLGGYVYDEDKPDLDLAGETAKNVFDNWDDDAWRNAYIMALHDFVSNMVYHHRHEIQEALNKSAASAVAKARRAIVKAYVTDTLETVAKEFDETEHPRAPGGSEHGGEFIARNEAAQRAAHLAGAYAQRARPEHKQDQQVEFVIQHQDGKREHFFTDGTVPKVPRNAKIVQIRGGGIEAPITLGGDVFNTAQALGMSADRAGSAGAAAQGLHDTLSQEGWGQRLITASRNLRYATGADAEKLSPFQRSVRVATGVGESVGKHGPEVQRVLGPHMRRYSYKYRGTVAEPDQRLQVARDGLQTTSQGKKEPVSALQRKLTLALARERDNDGLDAIPTEQESRLLLRTGNTAPSHGFIIDAHGGVRQQAHGYADDHYVPFNLRDLHALNNGHYVRSRAFGGPTTEDIALAMKTGTNSFETISRNGIYRVEFFPRTNKAGRKVGAWAQNTAGDAQQIMVNRYGRLLDAIKHGKVEDPQGGQALALNGRGYEVALQSLQKQFPYFIKKVEYHPATGDRSKGFDSIRELERKNASHTDLDTGYVRPYYLKPSEATQGYWDSLLGGHRSYDELDAYRLGKARVWARMKAFDDQRRRDIEERVHAAEQVGRGVGLGVSPSTVTGRQAARAEAVGGDYGSAVRSTPATRSDLDADKISPESTARLIGLTREVMAALPADAHIDKRMADLRRLVNLEDQAGPDNPEAEKEFSTYFRQVQDNHEGARTELFDLVDDATKEGSPVAGRPAAMAAYRELVSTPWTLAEQQDAEQGVSGAEFAELSPEAMRSTREGERYLEWERLFSRRGRRHQLQRTMEAARANNQAMPGEKVQRELREMDAEAAQWERVHPSSGKSLRQVYEDEAKPEWDGLPERKWYENMIDKAEGRPPRHELPEEPTLPKDLSSDDEERKRTAQEKWEQEMLRGLGSQDWS